MFAAALLCAPLAIPALVSTPGCAARGPDLVARMASAKSMAEFSGFSASGPPSTGTIASGGDAKVPLQLKSGCYQIFVFPGDGLGALDLTLADPSGTPVGTVLKQDGFSALKYCPTISGSYTLTAKSPSGSGSFIAQTYTSSDKSPTPDGSSEVAPGDCGPDGEGCAGTPEGGGDDCMNVTELPPGTTAKGTTSRKYASSIHWSCAAADGPAAVYRVHVDQRKKLIVDLNAKFDAVMAVFRSMPGDAYLCDTGNEIECSDDSEGSTTKSHIELVADPGDYGIVIGGYDASDRGDFEVRTRLDDPPSLEKVCAAARTLIPGVKQTDSIGGLGSAFQASCATSAGDEVLYKLDIKQRSRVRLQAKSGAGDVVLSVRRHCEEESSEEVCSNAFHIDGYSWLGTREPGVYTVIADTADPTRSGTIDLTADVAPELGAGTADGDTCKYARPISSTPSVTFDTFAATADIQTGCTADAGADVVYKLDVKTKSHVTITPGEDEGAHVVAIQKSCGDRRGELACDALSAGRPIEATLDPGSYYVVIKAKKADSFGRVKVGIRVRDLAGAAAACKSAPVITNGKSVSGSTRDKADNFSSPGCGGVATLQNSGDMTYQFTLKERSKVTLSLNSSTFSQAILSLRSDCSDPSKGEIVCSNQYSKSINRDLDPGTYYVVVDGWQTKAEGDFTLDLSTKPVK
ncbi:MAG: hypothetical protein ACHREM_09910 [Polyangiales bacterium]